MGNLQEEILLKMKEFGSTLDSTTQGNLTSAIIKFVDEFKPLLDSIKGEDHTFWFDQNIFFVKTTLSVMFDNLHKFCEKPEILTMEIEGFPYKTLANSFKIAYMKIGNFEMSEELRKQYESEIRIFNSVTKVSEVFNPANRHKCYIATMAYGSCDHPQVLILRRFRDECLSNFFLGQIFIRVYYFISPKFVYIFKNQERLNRAFRKYLDKFINKFLKKYS